MKSQIKDEMIHDGDTLVCDLTANELWLKVYMTFDSPIKNLTSMCDLKIPLKMKYQDL